MIYQTDTQYVVDARGLNITDLAGNKMNQSANQIFTINGDSTPPVITIDPYITTPTNQDITVTASTNE